MSSDAPGFLSFTCPKCSKRLRAPDKLAGQKLVCPQCSASIRVPGVLQKTGDDDDWLSLESPASSPEIPAKPKSSDRPKSSDKPMSSKDPAAKTKDPNSKTTDSGSKTTDPNSKSKENSPRGTVHASEKVSQSQKLCEPSVAPKKPTSQSKTKKESPAATVAKADAAGSQPLQTPKPLPREASELLVADEKSRVPSDPADGTTSAKPVSTASSSPNNISSSPNNITSASLTKRSVFDDDLPDLIPIETDEPQGLVDIPIPLEEPELIVQPYILDLEPLVNDAEIVEEDDYALVPEVIDEIPDDLEVLEPISVEPEESISIKPLAPPSEPIKPPSKKRIETSSPLLEEWGDELRLAPTLPIEERHKPKPSLVGSLEDIMLEQEALVPTSNQTNDEFGFKCHVCQTMLYARESQVGTRIRCPDCYSESTVPKPPPRKQRKSEKESLEVTLAPIDSQSIRDPARPVVNTDQLLEQASEDLKREKEELEGIRGSFDSKRWIMLVFWFFQDPAVIVSTVCLSILSCGWIGFVGLAPTLAKAEGVAIAILQAIVFLVPLVPIGGSVLLVSLCIFTMVANQLKRVDDWPFSRMGDAFGDAIMFIAALLLSVVPGGMLGTIFNTLLGNYLGTITCSMISIWLLLPFIFLSMANNNRISEPYSKEVHQSLKSRADAWGAMYLQTMFAYSGYFVLVAWAYMPGMLGEFLAGLFLPLFAFFVMNQYGLLAGRLSEVTELGFEGDFSRDFVE